MHRRNEKKEKDELELLNISKDDLRDEEKKMIGKLVDEGSKRLKEPEEVKERKVNPPL